MRGQILILFIILNIALASAIDVAYVLKNPRNPNYDYLTAFSELSTAEHVISSSFRNLFISLQIPFAYLSSTTNISNDIFEIKF